MFPFTEQSHCISITLLLFLIRRIIAGSDFQFPSENPNKNGCSSGNLCLKYIECASLHKNDADFNFGNRNNICGWERKEPKVCCKKPKNQINRHKQLKTFKKSGCGKVMRNVPTTPKTGVIEVAIVGGTDAMKGSWPWMAAIFFEDDKRKRSPFCGGSVINVDSVLTAAHCFLENNSPKSEYVVILGALVLGEDTDGLEVQVTSVSVHHDYKYPSVYNDIAILKLKTRVAFIPNIHAVCLPGPNFSGLNLDGDLATITGWGHLEFGGLPAKILQEVVVPIVSNSECNKIYTNLLGRDENLPMGVTKGIICAGDDIDRQDACQGDSGGPLVYHHKETGTWVIIGIIASGFECGRGIPGIYTRVSQYKDWIEQNI